MIYHEPLHAVFTTPQKPATDDSTRAYAFMLGVRDRKAQHYGKSVVPWLSQANVELAEAYDAGYEAKGDKAA